MRKAFRYKEAFSRRFEKPAYRGPSSWYDVNPEVEGLKALEGRAHGERLDVEYTDYGNRADQRRVEREALNASLEGLDWVCL